jgi:putative membrane protein
VQTNVVGFVSIFVSAVFLTFAIHRIDNSSIASARRIFGLFFVASLIWLLFYSAGIAYSILSGNSNASVTGFILGGFLTISLELLVINGVFLHSTIWSLLLSLLHPLTIFSLLIASSSSLNLLNRIFPLIIGTLIIALVLIFLLKMKHFETRRHNISSLNLLQAFLKTWTSKNPKELEQYFTIYSQSQETITKIVKFVTPTKDIILVLPDVHPGPFYPVGSYNLSETIHRKLRMTGSLSIVLHGTGGHERNLPSNYYTNEYAERVRSFVASLSTDSSKKNHETRGPLQVVLGQTTVTCITFDDEILMTVSNAPYNSDDLDPAILQEIKVAAAETGFGVSVVDAHNCIGGEDGQSLKATRKEWGAIFERLRTMHASEELQIGFSHSSEIGFTPGADISEGGIAVLIFENSGPTKNVLIVADSNNVVVGLREIIARALKEKGFQLIELCTSDTHNLAARSLVQRGYFALGEATPKDKIVEVINDLASLADRRIGTCDFVAASFPLKIPLIGNEPLEDFAAVTNKAFAFSKTFAKTMIPVTFALIAVTTILF